jgi:hypothetical protein
MSFAAVMAAAGAGLGAISSISGANYQAAVAKNNALIANQNAAAESVAAQTEAQRRDKENAGLLSEQIASQSTSGVAVSSRSAQQAGMLSYRIGRREAQDISQAGSDAAQRLKQDAANFRAQASQARLQGYLNAAGSLIGGASNIMQRKGLQSDSRYSTHERIHRGSRG